MTSRQPLRHRERLDRWARQVPRPDYREGGLDSMLWVLIALYALALVAFGVWA